MNKELTKQYRDGTLPCGFYYFTNGKDTYPIHHSQVKGLKGIEGVEVVDNVPTYDQFVELTEKVYQFSQQVKKVEKYIDMASKYMDKYNDELKKNDELVQKIHETKEALKFYENFFCGDEQPDGTYLICVRENAWGRVEVIYKPNIAKEYLEKRGVK